MVALGSHRARGGLAQCRVGLDGLVEHFDPPPFLVGFDGLGRSEGEVAADEMEDSLSIVLVCKDLPDQENRKVEFLDEDLQGAVGIHGERVSAHEAPVTAVLFSERHKPVALHGHNEVLVELVFDELHVLDGGIPDVRQHPAVVQLPLAQAVEHGTQHLVLRHPTAPSGPASLGIGEPLVLVHHLEADGNVRAVTVVEATHQVDSLDAASLAVVMCQQTTSFSSV